MGKKLSFYKMSGSGNDFIIIDNRSGLVGVNEGSAWARRLCRRKVSVGADGLILIEPPTMPNTDFKWRFYNADGSEAEMCGNGGRCAARFAYVNLIASPRMTFETIAGLIRAEVTDHRVKLEMMPSRDLRMDIKVLTNQGEYVVHFINTGVPHVVYFVSDLNKVNILELGRSIRFHAAFQPAGTNVNFVRILDKENISIRTYERGVEDETLACGTGSVAAAIIASLKHGVVPPVHVQTRGGEKLDVYFKSGPGGINNVFLEGEAKIVYEGLLREEEL
ncbi:MAG TPA: diaminopimelate epimerase [Proteobacteria bacterium]|mgnify:CR=1 FL=1|nr:diaminopimelate epimerase [Pseudomonadota bacterium]